MGCLISSSVTSTGLATIQENYQYDPLYRFVIRKEIPCPSCQGSPVLAEEFSYHPLWGKPIRIRDENCQEERMAYDALGRKVVEIDNYGQLSILKYQWDPTGYGLYRVNRLKSSQPYYKQYYSAEGLLLKEESQNFSGQNISKVYEYNNKGQKTLESNFHTSAETPSNTEFLYDNFFRLSQINSPYGVTTHNYIYEANTHTLRITTTNPDGTQSKKWKYYNGKVKQASDKGGMIDYIYDISGEYHKIYKDGVLMLRNTFDQYGRKASAQEPNAGTIHYQYDAYGQLVEQTDNMGNMHVMEYDGLGRQIKRVGPEGTTLYEFGCANPSNTEGGDNGGHEVDASGSTSIVRSTEDLCCRQALVKVTGYNGMTQEYTYDDHLNTLSTTESIDGNVFVTANEYNGIGQLTSTTHPSGYVERNVYNSLGYLTRKEDQNNNVVYELLETNGRGQPTKYELGNGKTSVTSYTLDLPTHYRTPGIQDLEMQYDYSTANLLSRKDHIYGLTESYTYDNLHRLTSSQIQGLAAQSYDYDQPTPSESKGNLMQSSAVGKFGYHPHKIHAMRKAYNPTNNQSPPAHIPQQTQEIDYTAFHRPGLIAEGGHQLELMYSPEYDRVHTRLSHEGALTRTMYYLGQTEKLVTPAGEKWVTYLSAAPGTVAMIVTENGGHKSYFTYTDHLGRLLTLTDNQGSIVAQQSFTPWGQRRDPGTWQTLANTSSSGIDWLYRGYTGHEHLPEFGLINMNARLYDPVTTRMLSPDNVLALPYTTGGHNRYLYAMGNPMKYTDPSGDSPIAPILIGMAISGAFNVGLQYADNGGDLNNFNWGSFAVSMIAGGVGGGMSAGLTAAGIGGFYNGAITGASTGLINSVGMGIVNNNLSFKSVASQTILGAGIGGLVSGIGAGLDGRNFWDGDEIGHIALAVDKNMPYISQSDPNSCGGTTGEMVLKAQGIDAYTSDDIMGWAYDGRIIEGSGKSDLGIAIGIRDNTGLNFDYTLNSDLGSADNLKNQLVKNINNGRSVVISQSHGHSVAIKGVYIRQVTKVNGVIKSTSGPFIKVFDPFLSSTESIYNIQYLSPSQLYSNLNKIITFGY